MRIQHLVLSYCFVLLLDASSAETDRLFWRSSPEPADGSSASRPLLRRRDLETKSCKSTKAPKSGGEKSSKSAKTEVLFEDGCGSQAPSNLPSALPSVAPSKQPSTIPSSGPSTTPSESALPSVVPSQVPSESAGPSSIPSSSPSQSVHPSVTPSAVPSNSAVPSSIPSSVPSKSVSPSAMPSTMPSESVRPSQMPSVMPSTSAKPSVTPGATTCDITDPGCGGVIIDTGTPCIPGVDVGCGGGDVSAPPSEMPSMAPSESSKPSGDDGMGDVGIIDIDPGDACNPLVDPGCLGVPCDPLIDPGCGMDMYEDMGPGGLDAGGPCTIGVDCDLLDPCMMAGDPDCDGAVGTPCVIGDPGCSGAELPVSCTIGVNCDLVGDPGDVDGCVIGVDPGCV